MAKLQIKSEKPLLLEDFFRGSWSKSADTDTDSPKFRNPTIEGKRVKEKVYIYIYINIKKNIINISLLFCSFTGEKKRGAENRTVSVSVSKASHKSEVVRNYDFGRRKLNLCAPETMDFRRVNLLNAFLLKIACLRIPKFGQSKKRWYLCNRDRNIENH